MPKKGKGNNKKNQPRKNKSNKSPNKSNKQSSKREGQAFSKEILRILGQITSVLREVDQLKGSPLYETAIKLDELCDTIITLQSGSKNNRKSPKIWGFEDTENEDPQIILNRLTLWIKQEQPDSFIGDKFEFKANLAEGRGVIAAKDLKEGEHAMSIQRKIMMTSTYALNKSDDKIRRFLKKDPLCKQVSSLALVLFVWYERMKGKRSYWKSYLDGLPKWFGLPHECKIKELIPFLGGSLILDKIIRLKISHLRHYTYSRQMLNRAGIEPGLRLIDYLWAAGVVMTRQNRIPSEHNFDESELALIPSWDLCNYQSGKITTYFNTKEQKNEMFIMNEVKKGEQIYIYYGGQRNELLYLNSGFVFHDNPNDELELDLRLNTNDILYKVKALQIKNAKLTNPIKCLLPVIGYNKYDTKEITLDATIDEIEMKEIEEKKEKEKEKRLEIEKAMKEFDDNDISTKWILSVFESQGLSIPPPSIRFARISCMNKEEVMGFMQRFYNKQKKENKEEVISEEVVELENVDPKDQMVKNEEEIGEPKELINIENELKAWNLILNKAQIMFDFFTEKLNLCIHVHIDGKNIDDDEEEEELYGNNNGNIKQFDGIEILNKLKSQKKHHVALSFELLDIERQHYKSVIDVMKKGIVMVEERLNRVLKGVTHKLEVDETRIESV